MNRIKDGFVYVRNPMNARQISRIALAPDIVDCIVFWTKNPKPFMEHLDELRDYRFYFQFTLTGYGKGVEPYVPDKKTVMLPVFQELSQKIGADKVVWRYDPILFNGVYTKEYHLQAFAQIAEALEGCTQKCVISFADEYAKNRRNMRRLHARKPDGAALMEFCGQLSRIAGENGMKTASCAENLDLGAWGIEHNCCIDRQLIEKLTGSKIRASKDKNQRRECGCVQSVDIGAYDTCPSGCMYCYANRSYERARKNALACDAGSPLLCGQICEEDRITERPAESMKEAQLALWDLQPGNFT